MQYKVIITTSPIGWRDDIFLVEADSEEEAGEKALELLDSGIAPAKSMQWLSNKEAREIDLIELVEGGE